MSVRHAVHQDNLFLTAPIGRLFLSNALAMAVVMSMGGILNVADGIIVGRFIGPEALAAVSLAFPVSMVLAALATLVGGGMSSLMARHLGAGERDEAGAVFARAHGLALAISTGLIVLAAVFGAFLVDIMAAGNADIAGLAKAYLWIIILGTPVQLLLGIHADALRNEGLAGMIAGLSVLVNLINIAANWLAIVVLGLGISGSALGTVLAQVIGLALLIGVRFRRKSLLPMSALRVGGWFVGWAKIVRLGLPLCLSFIGIAVSAIVVILALRVHAGADHDTFVAAYGVVTRLLGFAFLPQMAFALTIQSISGNNAGAGLHDRVRAALHLAMGAAFVWCLSVVAVGYFAGSALGAWFSDDPRVAGTVALILRPMLLLYAMSGPVLVLALHFQALGQPGRTAALTLIKPWLLIPVLVLTLSTIFGVGGIWMAYPIADGVALSLALLIGRSILLPAAKRPTLIEDPT